MVQNEWFSIKNVIENERCLSNTEEHIQVLEKFVFDSICQSLDNQEENPGFGVTEVSKKAGEMWAKIDSDTKDRFEKKAKAAKEKYEEDYKVNLKTFLF